MLKEQTQHIEEHYPKSFIIHASRLALIPRFEQAEEVGQGLWFAGVAGNMDEVVPT